MRIFGNHAPQSLRFHADLFSALREFRDWQFASGNAPCRPMKIATIIARVLLGLAFVVFGLNFFLNFIPAPPPPPGLAGDYFKVFAASGYTHVVGAMQLLSGLLLLIGRFVPLGLTIHFQHLDFSPSDGASRLGPCRGRDPALGFSCLELSRTFCRSIASIRIAR